MTIPYRPDVLQRFTLSMSSDYVSHWTFWDAIRELLQNAIDQRTANPASKVLFTFDADSQTMVIGSTFADLHPKTLLLGNTSKAGDHTKIGQFGEGYKVAMLVLTRMQFEVRVHVNGKLWTPKMRWSDEFEDHVLTVDITDDPSIGTEFEDGVYFEISGVEQRQFDDVAENYLPDAITNQIFEESEMAGRIFVMGLYVCTIEEFRFGYNLKSDRIRLNRDRDMANAWEVRWETSRLWEKHGNDALLYDNLEQDVPDTRDIVTHNLTPTMNTYIVDRYLEENPGEIPVSTDAEMKRNTGKRRRMVPVKLGEMLRRMHTFAFTEELTPGKVIEQFHHEFRHCLPAAGKRRLDLLVADSKCWAGEVTDPEGK